MKKYIIYTRSIPGCSKGSDVPAIVEVDVQLISALEDPSIIFLSEGECKFRILSPEWLLESTEINKEKVITFPVYYSHAIFHTIEQARSMAERMIRESFEFAKRKKKVEFTEEEVAAKCAEIKEIKL